MNFSKSLFFVVLFLSLNNFGMLNRLQIIKNLSKGNLNRQQLLLQNNKRFFSPVPNDLGEKSFKELKSEPASKLYKFEQAELEKERLEQFDPKKSLDFLSHFNDIKSNHEKLASLHEILNSRVAVLNINPKEALEILYYLKQSEFSSEKKEQLKNFFQERLASEQNNIKRFNELDTELQKIVLKKYKEGYKKISTKEMDSLVKNSDTLTDKDSLRIIIVVVVGVAILPVVFVFFEFIEMAWCLSLNVVSDIFREKA